MDPPFNTQEAFDHYDDKLEHAQWLSMLYPRLQLLKELLHDEGTIFLHIDDNELGYVIVLMDEIFGRDNRTHIVSFKQGAATGHKAINPGLVSTTNYILIYCKNKSSWKPKKLFVGRDIDTRYNQYIVNFDEHFSKWKTQPLLQIFADTLGIKKSALKKELGEDYEQQLSQFVINNAHRVIRPARPDYKSVGKDVKEAIDISKNMDEVWLLEREGNSDMYFFKGERWLFYKDKLKFIDGEWISGEPLSTMWADLLSNNLHNEGGVNFPKGKKPEALIKRVIELSTDENDYVLDSFLGSGTTIAVAHKMKRRYVGIEMGPQANTHVIPRLQNVISGEDGGISKAVNWQGGGGFSFYTLGNPVFDDQGFLNAEVKFKDLASYVWWLETKTSLNQTESFDSPYLGTHDGVAYYLLYNGILGDRRPNSGNVLTLAVLNYLNECHAHEGKRVVIGEASRLGDARLEALNIEFKQIPYSLYGNQA
ncbi:site-specific DNA-methyltransferase [Acinetobacter sp. YH12124]|uniref:site-specific DNA-methyltransferase n=1 Tax=Acinetobacter sp. YH12124 TaxID=2601109 RepID=UPI0035A1BF67